MRQGSRPSHVGRCGKGSERSCEEQRDCSEKEDMRLRGSLLNSDAVAMIENSSGKMSFLAVSSNSKVD